jgi:carbon storage regulator
VDLFKEGSTMLVLSRKRGEKIMIGETITVMVIDVRGDKVRLGIEAPAGVRIDREEVRAARLAEREGKEPAA